MNFLADKGLLYGLSRMSRSAWYRLRDRSLSGKLRTSGFRCGRMPRIAGLARIQVGRNFNAGDALWLEAVTQYAGQQLTPQLVIGNNVSASDNVHIACTHSVTIGSGTLLGSRVIITDHAHGIYHGAQQSSPDVPPTQRPLSQDGVVIIGENVWIGDGVAVLAGARIGDGAIIGANSVVTGDVPPRTIAVGAPARPIRQWNEAARQWLATGSPKPGN